jgi:hypothetical protein
MPVEGHWARARTPLSRRDKLLLSTAGGAAGVAAVVGALVLAHGGGGGRVSCLLVKVPSTMGGATLRECGAAAHDFCHTQGARDAIVAAACRAQGYAADLP